MVTAVKFNAIESDKAKDRGMKRAAAKYRHMHYAKQLALFYAEGHGTCNIDVLSRMLEFSRCPPLGNAAGSVFKGPEWECCGWVKSKRVSSHSRMIRVWKLKENNELGYRRA